MRKRFVQAEIEANALAMCPWASEIREAVGGFWCFESIDDAENWDRQS